MKMCKDNRCLLSSNNKKKLKKKFIIRTLETREGKGRWEKCLNCGLVINRKGIKLKKLKKYYNKEYFRKNSLILGKTLNVSKHFNDRKKTVKKIFLNIKKYLKSHMRAFELGAGAGELLYYVNKRVKYSQGNEINRQYSNFIQKKLKIRCDSDDFLDVVYEKKFDFVISINTIDHIYNPRLYLKKVFEILNSRGLFYLEIPNDEQLLNKYLQPSYKNNFSRFMYQKAHYYSFNSTTACRLLKQIGFKIIKVESRHDYTFRNFLNWYFLGKPQVSHKVATSGNFLFSRNLHKVHKQLNKIITNNEDKFQNILSSNKTGETLSILCNK